ncbi:sporulation integral membrane protein YtvI [Mangrovibacillus cuniculi]|uniref:Sporulation integral membrane protein YtvI n=1 Tax=Mangrovibacillus cuniculi TaxID=2593652 RepID=A0A7S8CC23_9BACI|nr:sporulation integral membrane protein YtvI [Mangrovibacillus cuniculi]QPC47205.1 sporulation integral membrane protein YtvI [Mangrovibacillus cuniculi]
MNTVVLQRLGRLILVVGGFLLLLYLFFWSAKLAYPFYIALGIAFLVNPVVTYLQEKQKLPRTLSVIVVLCFLGFSLIGILFFLITEIVEGANVLSHMVPVHIETLVNSIEDWIMNTVIPFFKQMFNQINVLSATDDQSLNDQLRNLSNQVIAQASQFTQGFLQKLPSLFAWIPNVATVFIFAILATFFISKDWYTYSRKVHRWIPVKAKSGTMQVVTDLRKAFFGFIRAQLTLVSITGFIVLVGLLILRVEYVFTIALISAIVDILPYLGTGILFVPWIIYSFIMGNISLGIGLSVLYVIIVVQRQIMEPKILSSSIGLDPLATLIAVFVGFQLFGFLGLVAGPVVLVLFSSLRRANVFGNVWSYIYHGSNIR